MEGQEQLGVIEITDGKIKRVIGCRIGKQPDQIWFKDIGANTLQVCTGA